MSLKLDRARSAYKNGCLIELEREGRGYTCERDGASWVFEMLLSIVIMEFVLLFVADLVWRPEAG